VFFICQLLCALFAINVIKDLTELGNIMDSNLYMDSAVGMPLVMLFIGVGEDKLPCCAQATTKLARLFVIVVV
jgi:hypothetical protein